MPTVWIEQVHALPKDKQVVSVESETTLQKPASQK